jgi:hypothetical protein
MGLWLAGRGARERAWGDVDRDSAAGAVHECILELLGVVEQASLAGVG